MIKTYLNGELMAGVDLQLFVVNISASFRVQRGQSGQHAWIPRLQNQFLLWECLAQVRH